MGPRRSHQFRPKSHDLIRPLSPLCSAGFSIARQILALRSDHRRQISTRLVSAVERVRSFKRILAGKIRRLKRLSTDRTRIFFPVVCPSLLDFFILWF